ncbi:fumarylacetoacetate hydrolase family protein [Subtercola frigoramans]|uniref:2-keto-4-pentenoate hydratase/2-oxohepta-3-ene-1,7-dioic acid hydratase in catechol pathway n=1 Tax=Subtercola frigoramans TaxID=120298 RepID=A0ABS2L1L8_9MICO|nr:fumarylacetoacetate hydrolase family protein [Subtercola frigoramans]MBM7470660.1 2-keto-4-pentenoate hydratase/2-oxohepta-3-ene-1,7-dioic acid hydratase in catechol pathway [Subtercola frigoramans]
MRLANLSGRAVLVFGDSAVDVERASSGAFGSDPQALFEHWAAFVAWAESVEGGGEPVDRSLLGPPVPRPQQVFAIGINYREHQAEAGYPEGSLPVTFTKFPTCLTGPDAVVELPPGSVDWEVELVIAISRRAHHVRKEEAWDHVAGLMVGQDLSEREDQLAGQRPQFSLAKSYPGFGPTGPWLVTPDEFEDPDDLAITCSLSGEVMQDSRTSAMIYGVADLIYELSRVCVLLPGDIIFTGTPSGIGNARTPKRFITVDDSLRSGIEGIGWLENTFTV